MIKGIIYSIIGTLSAVWLLWTVVFAQSSGIPSDFFSTLLVWNFGYLTQNISVKTINTTSITFESPVIRDENGADVKRYVLSYGPYPLSQLLAGWSQVSFNDFTQKTFTFTSFSGSTFSMTLDASDNLVANKIYYVTAMPIDSSNKQGEVSWPDICFRLQDQKNGLGNTCVSNSTHGTANMVLANVSHTKNGNTITLRWTAVAGATKVDIFLLNNTTQVATKLVTKNMTDETYSFPLTTAAPQIVRFIPVDANGDQAGTQVDYTMNESLTPDAPTPPPAAPAKPSIPKVPRVWPEQNMILVLIGTILVYGVIRFVRSKKRA